MNCERVDLLLGLLEDALDDDERQAVEGHLEGCETCKETIDAYRSTADALHDLPEERPSEEARGRAYAAMMELMAQDAAVATSVKESAPAALTPASEAAPASAGKSGTAKRGLVIPFVQFVAAAACLALAVSFLLGPERGSDATTAMKAQDSGAPVADERVRPRKTEALKAADGAPAPSAAPGELTDAPEGAVVEDAESEDVEADFARRVTEELAGRPTAGAKQPEETRRVRLKEASEAKARELGRLEEARREQADALESKLERQAAKAKKAKSDTTARKARRVLDAEGERAAAGEGADGMTSGGGKDAPAPPAAPADADAPAEDYAEDFADDEAPAGARADAGPGVGQTRDGRQRPAADPAAEAAAIGPPKAAWQLHSPSGRRIYLLLADSRVVYRDVAPPRARAGGKEAEKVQSSAFEFATSGGAVRVFPLASPDTALASGATVAAPKADFRVAEELLAIVASEVNGPEDEDGVLAQPTAKSSAPRGRADTSAGRARAVALLRVLGERLPANEGAEALRERVRLLRSDHLRSMKRMRSSAPALDMDEAKGR